jgi:biopolymer transport protein TolR
VLLIIFMVTAPMLQRSIEVNLPVASRTETVADERLFLDVPAAFQTNRTVFIEKEPIRLQLLGERLRQMMETRTDRQVFIRSDGQLTVQQLVDVFDTLKAAGITTAGLVTDTPRVR